MRLQLEPDIKVIGEAQDGATAVKAAAELRPDVLVMDYEMPLLNGAEAARRIQNAGVKASVVMLSIHDNTVVRTEAAEAGVQAFVAKHEPSERLLAAIREAARARKEGPPSSSPAQ